MERGVARIRPGYRMRSPSRFRWFLWVCCWALALSAARPAAAAAPMCDERGASMIAPPPVLLARDIRIDASTPRGGCDLATSKLLQVGTRAHPQPSLVSNDTFDEAWVRPARVGLPPPDPGATKAAALAIFPVCRGHEPGVFRPPRV